MLPQTPERIIRKFLPLIHKDNVIVFRTLVVVEISHQHHCISGYAERMYNSAAKKVVEQLEETTPITAKLLLDTIS